MDETVLVLVFVLTVYAAIKWCLRRWRRRSYRSVSTADHVPHAEAAPDQVQKASESEVELQAAEDDIVHRL